MVCNVCAFHFNLPCHFSPRQTLKEKEISLLNSSPERALLFYFPVLSLPPAIPYSCRPGRKVQGRDPFLIPLSYSNIAHSQSVVQQSEVGPLSRVAPPCMNVCVWSELSLTLSPHEAAPLPQTIPTPPPPPPPHPPSPSIAGGATGSGAERGL